MLYLLQELWELKLLWSWQLDYFIIVQSILLQKPISHQWHLVPFDRAIWSSFHFVDPLARIGFTLFSLGQVWFCFKAWISFCITFLHSFSLASLKVDGSFILSSAIAALAYWRGHHTDSSACISVTSPSCHISPPLALVLSFNCLWFNLLCWMIV